LLKDFFSLLELNEWLTISIAFIALALAVYEGWATRRHNRLSVISKLSISFSFIGEGEDPQIFITNTGVGLAELIMLTGEVDNHIYNLLVAEDFRDLIRKELPLIAGTTRIEWTVFDKGTFLAPNDKVALLKLKDTKSNEQQKGEFSRLMKSIQIKIQYLSIYRELTEESSSSNK
jgi:hypothetical protein